MSWVYMKKIVALSFIFAFNSSAMDLVPSTSLLLLAKETVTKIIACSDLQSQRALRLTCHGINEIKKEDLLNHSPLFLNRHDHKLSMVHAAQKDNAPVM